jgi:membrane protein DedA with SNARE-associated domain
MIPAFQFLIEHGYTVLFLGVFAEQMGLPLPSVLFLIGAGALSATHHFNFTIALGLAFLAALITDIFWYELGRRLGARVLRFLCRIALEPDSCVRQTEDVFARHGARSLLYAKFVPGLNTVAPPLAGIFQMRFSRYVAFAAMGSFLWVAVFMGVGYAFSDQLERVVAHAQQLGARLVLLLVVALTGYIGWKYLQRRRFIRQLRIDRITPEELKRKLDAGEDVVVVDLRHSLDFEADPATIPGAIQLSPDQLEQRHQEIPRDRELVLYCT